MNALTVRTASRRLKVTAVLDAEPFRSLGAVGDNAPSRTELLITIGTRPVFADIATKSLRKAVKILSAAQPGEEVILIIQGVLSAENHIEEAGLVAQVKTPQTSP